MSGKRTVVIVDPLSTGANLANEFTQQGFQVIKVASRVFPRSLIELVPPSCKNIKFAQDLAWNPEQNFQENLDRFVRLVRFLPNIEGVIAGTETGVAVGDALAEKLDLPNNGSSMSRVRRNKFMMGEQVRRRGLRAVQQACAWTWEEVAAFVDRCGFPVVIKPLQSAGSDNVHKCSSLADLKIRFKQIIHQSNVLGEDNEAAVVQEFLEGPEFVVDTVSCQGVHKVVAVWQYDKGPANSASFCYFGLELLSGDSEKSTSITSYVLKVLDALNIVNSPGHAEIILTSSGPCLVEIGARPHGGEGVWLPMAKRCLGYTQLEATVLANTDPAGFNALPSSPVLKNNFAMEVLLVSRTAGMLEALPMLGHVEALPTFDSMVLHCKIGQPIAVTSDYLSTPGSIILIGPSLAALRRDRDAIRSLEPDFFSVAESSDEVHEKPAS